MFFNLILPYYLDGALDLGLPMQCNSHLAEAAFAEHSANFVPLFDVRYLLKSSEVFEAHHVFKLVRRIQSVVFSCIQN